MVKNLNGSKSFYEATPNTSVIVNEGLAFESTDYGGGEVGDVLVSNGAGTQPSFQNIFDTVTYPSAIQVYTYETSDSHFFSEGVRYFEMWMCGGGGAAANSNAVSGQPRWSGGAGGGAATGYYVSTNIPFVLTFALGAGGTIPNGNGGASSSFFRNSILGPIYGELSIDPGTGGSEGTVDGGTGEGGGGGSLGSGSWTFIYPGGDGESNWLSSDTLGNTAGGNNGGSSFFCPGTGASGLAQLAKYGAGGGIRTGAQRGGGGGFLLLKEYF